MGIFLHLQVQIAPTRRRWRRGKEQEKPRSVTHLDVNVCLLFASSFSPKVETQLSQQQVMILGHWAIFKGISLSRLLWWYLVVMLSYSLSAKLIHQTANARTHTHTHLYFWLTFQCQSKGGLPNPPPLKRGAWDFKKGLISLNNGTLCAQIAIGTTRADTKSTQTEASQLSVGIVCHLSSSLVHAASVAQSVGEGGMGERRMITQIFYCGLKEL